MTRTTATRQVIRRARQHRDRSHRWRIWQAERARQYHARRRMNIVTLPLALMGAAAALFVAMDDPAAMPLLYTTCFLMLPWMYANRRYNQACKATRRARHNYRLLEGHTCRR